MVEFVLPRLGMIFLEGIDGSPDAFSTKTHEEVRETNQRPLPVPVPQSIIRSTSQRGPNLNFTCRRTDVMAE